MRALLVVNPKATTTSGRGQDVLARALRSEVDLEVEYTRRRGHAAELARRAVKDGLDVVVTLGGDGTVNEVVNGLLADVPLATGPDDDTARPAVPMLAVVPGGSTNVFARALGLPGDWADGTGVILEALREGRTRSIGLGRVNERWFTFCAGFGLDAEVIRRVERARVRGRVSTPGLYLRSAVAQYFAASDRRGPLISLERDGAEAEHGLGTVIVQNTAPWTYLGNRPVNPNPDASFDLGLDVLATRGQGLPSTVRTAAQMLSRQADPHGRRVLRLHDLDGFALRAQRPVAFQVDGDYLGEREHLRFRAEPQALRVVC
ncbi:MAG: diacylglycerol kinase family lipid kinase [Micromonosporaceae bacterium]|nr:diacylglycerol kinase family lipid kinase [Micromonosporaceae bacterium]